MIWKYKVGEKIKMKKRTYNREDVAVGWVPAMDDYQSIYTVVERSIGKPFGDSTYRVKQADGIHQFIVQEWQIRSVRREKMVI